MPEVYRKEYEDIQGEFAKLFDEVTEIIEQEESMTLAKLKKFLSRFSNLKPHVNGANTISDIMNLVQDHSSFTCCSILKSTATRFNLSSVVQKIDSYYKCVNEFCSQELTHHIYMRPFIISKSIHLTSSTTITFKLQWRPDKKTLSDIQSLLRQAFHEHSIDVHIVVVREGSVMVLCHAAQHMMDDLTRLAQLNKAMLLENGVTYLRVGDNVIVDCSRLNEVIKKTAQNHV